MTDITLQNRYGENYILKAINNNLYIFDAKQSPYMNVSLSDDNSYNFIDPEGGPMISIGDKLNDKIIKKITFSDGGYNLIIE